MLINQKNNTVATIAVIAGKQSTNNNVLPKNSEHSFTHNNNAIGSASAVMNHLNL